MGFIDAVTGNRMRVIPFLLLLVVGWLALSLLQVWNVMEPFNGFSDQYVGNAAVSGYIGIAVILAVLLVTFYLFAAAGESDPAPERFPPR